MHNCLPMGCLPSRSTAVSPIESRDQATNSRATAAANDHKRKNQQQKASVVNGANAKRVIANGGLDRTSKDNNGDKSLKSNRGRLNNPPGSQPARSGSPDSLKEGAEDEIMSILMDDERDAKATERPGSGDKMKPVSGSQDSDANEQQMESGNMVSPHSMAEDGVVATSNNESALVSTNPSQQGRSMEEENSTSFDEELNTDLLRQYIIVDFEITQLEDKDALRIYHEKIEQLEQLERELDMISAEAEEVAARSESNTQSGFQSQGDFNKTTDGESNSLISGATGGSMSPRSLFRRNNQLQVVDDGGKSKRQNKRIASNGRQLSMYKQSSNAAINGTSSSIINNSNSYSASTTNNNDSNNNNNNNANSNSNFSTVEEVFNRKIILEKERDKLKKEVEMVIIECDKLQSRYKKRDEILDKLFDGRTGNGLENHLEQQLNWLMEQKHYVDQVFYAWKRAETLTSQTCEQFASALELLKRMPMVQDDAQRAELTKSIGQLLIKSRQDMEQAQRYNPNVDAPFFTDTETERFDKIIETISSRSINQSDYSQIATVIQFAHKRAVSIRLWLEQILQITIARDSFELAEEYKWIAIQLRKERITLIKSRLQDPPYRSMAQAIQDQLIKQQQQQQHLSVGGSASNTPATNHHRARNNQSGNQLQLQQQTANEVNRDSGIDSDDIDIEEEIYRLLEMNKSRLEAAMAASSVGQQANNVNGANNYQLRPIANGQTSNGKTLLDDQMMRERIERRVRGEQQLAITNGIQLQPIDLDGKQHESSGSIGTANSHMSSSTTATVQSKLRVELDEATRQKLLRQVDQTHEKHRTRMESLRGSNKAKASDLIMSRMKQARKYQEASRLDNERG